MTRGIGIWKRRKSADSDEWIYGIGDYDRTYDNEADAREAFDVLRARVERFNSSPDRSYAQLRKDGHPLFVRKGSR